MFSAFSFLSLINTCKPGTVFFKCLCCKLNIHVDVYTHRRFQTVCPDPKKKHVDNSPSNFCNHLYSKKPLSGLPWWSSC